MTRRLSPEDRARLAEFNRARDARRAEAEKERRAATPRPRTISPRPHRGELERLEEANARADRLDRLDPPPPRPRTREECLRGPRPCPWACRYSLLHEVNPNGSIKVLHPDASGAPDLDYQGPSCALDVADAGPSTLEEIALLLNINRERARQIEAAALVKLRASRLRELADESEPLGCDRESSAWPW